MTAYDVMIDATDSTVDTGKIPPGTRRIAGYDTGTPDIMWDAQDWARFPRASRIHIDQSDGLPLFAAGKTQVADVERGAGTIPHAVAAVLERQKAGEYSTIYISAASLPDVAAALHGAGVKMNRVGYWVANWNLSEVQAAAMLGNEVVAVQWASPSSNPNTPMPGTGMTLRDANVDLSVTLPGWYPPPAPPVPWQTEALQRIQSLNAQTAMTAHDLGNLETLLKAHQ